MTMKANLAFCSRLPSVEKRRASVLLITLGFILLVTVIAVAFLVRSRSSLQTTQSYSREMVAKEVGEIGINALAAQFQKEIKDAATASTNLLLPTRPATVAEQNPRLSPLVRQTSDSNNVSTASAAKNGWTFDARRWKAPALLTDAQYDAQAALSLPKWVYVYGQPSAAADNFKDVVGRYAATVYDVGGLLDINEIGVPSGVPTGDKGSTAFVDLSALPGGSSLQIAAWRGGNSTVENYYGLAMPPYGNSTYSDAVNPLKAGSIASPASKLQNGANRFFSRMELIEAAKANKLGLTTSLLPNFRTRSESANRISVENVFAYGTNSTITLLHNDLKAKNGDKTFTVNRIDGTTESFTIKEGQPLMQNRFPLARLRWLADREADGTPKHQAEIQKYFGLTWNAGSKIFVYTSPDGSSAASKIKTLKDLATQINGSGPVREADFFEWLKAGIDPNTLGQTGGSTDRKYPSYPGGTPNLPWEMSKDLHILRIGANIIDQSDPDSIPTGIRSQFTDVANIEPNPFDSFGVENLPYLNEVVASALRDGGGHTGSNLVGYLQFEMWNPNRNALNGANPPRDFQGNSVTNFRVRATGGRVLMQPYVYVNATNPQGAVNNYYIKPMGGTTLSGQKEASNSAWSSLKRFYEYSQRNMQKSDFNSPDLAGSSVNFSLPATGAFFSEPYLANGSMGQDTSGVPSTDMFSYKLPARLGAEPVAGSNAIVVATVRAPNPAIPAGLLLNDIYMQQDTQPIGTNPAVTPANYTSSPLGAKAFNAVSMNSDGTTDWDIISSPVTLAVEVQDSAGNWRICQMYNYLAMNMRTGAAQGRQAAILSGDANTKGQGQWTSSSDTNNRCFGNWNEWEIRKGFPNTDPRTERFGLTDNIYASPGMSTRTHTNPTLVYPSGVLWNVDNGCSTSVGTSFAAGGSNESGAPRWGLLGTAPTVSVPADLALNIDPGNSLSSGYVWDPVRNNHHCYADSDGIVRPADARWVANDAHPVLPVSSFPKAADARPVFLDRPFRSVAELGVVFRDVPWKSVDLFSANSGDRRLLDIFSIEDRATMKGKVNPNLASGDTLKALLRGSTLNPTSATPSSIPNTTADSVAGIFSALSPSLQPVYSSANMTERLATNAISKPDGGYSPYKTQAENFIRSLSSTTDTRSWQLMLDVVAQSGRIAPPYAAAADFVVEGQKRFFVYLTLDRITGEIVDRHIEPVYE